MDKNTQSKNSNKAISQIQSLKSKINNKLNLQQAPVASNVESDFLNNLKTQQMNFEKLNLEPGLLSQTNFIASQQNQINLPNAALSNNKSTELESKYIDENKPNIIKISTDIDENLHVVSVIITIVSGSSYDHLFREVEQKSPEGRVALFEINHKAIPYFISKFHNKEFDSEFTQSNYEFVEKINEIFDYLAEIEPECVMFNYECCSDCGDFQFLLAEETNELIDFVLKKKMIFMFSDFSVKSLLCNWDEKRFGLNPFKKIGECSKYFNLKFDAETLKKCESPQLQIVGTLCESGECSINVMGGTIVFGVDKEKIDSEAYELKVLSVIDNKEAFNLTNQYGTYDDDSFDGETGTETKKNITYLHKSKISPTKAEDMDKLYVDINGKRGAVGHAILKYKSGGMMILSSGHWIELTHLNDVKIENLEKVSKNIYKNQYNFDIENLKNSQQMSQAEKSQKVSQLASQFIQQTSNNVYSKKMVYKKK